VECNAVVDPAGAATVGVDANSTAGCVSATTTERLANNAPCTVPAR
jgi:hypothetical protein